MNGYGDYDRMRNGGQPGMGGLDPYNRNDFMRDDFMEINSPRRSNFGGSVFANSDFPTARSDYPTTRSDFPTARSDYPTYRDDPYSPRNGFGPDLDRNSTDGRFEMRDNDPIFELDHLATYSSKTGVMHAEDGLRKLRQMENTTGIWTMRCSMVIERRFLVIFDKGNGEELERFPLELVHDPTAIFKDDKREIYTNLILFTVLDDPRKRNAQADMHIFQSITAPAQDIVDDIQAAKEGHRPVSGQRIPPPPMGPAPDPPRIGEDDIITRETPVLGFENICFDEEGSPWIGRRGNKSRFSYGFSESSNYGQGRNPDGFITKFSETNNQGPRHSNEGFSKPAIRTAFESHQARERDFHTTNINDDDMYNMRMSQRPGGFGGGLGATNRASYIPRDNDMDSGQNEALEKDVQLLNSCFDDIEKFVSRLQQAAEAYKELERRRRERSTKKSKNKHAGDGMLNMRARPPPGDDFIDIFEKFKFAFNLLAKLKAHIHDPNAPELVHFLFTPLSLIYEASRDPVHGGRDLAADAYKPAITAESKQLLLNCLTSKELELWQALGKSWTASRDEQRGYVEQYVPRFYNGWKPSPQSLQDDTREKIELAFGNHRSQIENREREDDARREASGMVLPYPTADRGNDSRYPRAARYDYRETEREDPNPYARSTKQLSTPPSGAITNPNVARYQEHVERHIDRNMDLHKPHPAPQRSKQDEMISFAQEVARSNGKVMEAVHERNGRNQKEITVEKGDLLQVLDDSRNWWKLKNCKGDIGYAPYTILKEYQVSDFDTDKTRGLRSSGEYNSHIPVNGVSHHVPPPPPPPPAPIQQKRQDDYHRDYNGDYDDRRDDYREDKVSPRQRRGGQPDYSDGHYSSDGSDRGYRDRKHNRNNYKRNQGYEDSDDSFNSVEHRSRGSRGSEKRRGRKESDKRDQNRWREPTPPLKKDRDDPKRSNQGSPRPLPPPPPNSKPPALRKHRDNAPRDKFQDELNRRVSKGGSNARLQPKPERQGTTADIKSTSTTDDVADWLFTKNFSDRTINILCAYNGEDLFRMKRREMDRLLGEDEAHRLHSLVTVQKTKAQYSTRSAAELNAILKRRKERSDGKVDGDNMGSPPSFVPGTPDYSDSDSDSEASDDFGNAGKTLRALLQQQRRRITSKHYYQ